MIAETPRPIWQDEAHTCGYLAISSLYASYRMDPTAHKVRFRLGTDSRANMFDETSLGTIHPDIFRVLYQDKFTIRDLDLSSPRFEPNLHAHVYNRHLALLLIKRPQSGNLHWVLAIDPNDGNTGQIQIIDSLAREPYTVTTRDFIEQHAVSVLLIYRPTEHEEVDATTLNAWGLASVSRALGRM